MLDRIRGHDLPPMLRWEAVIGERVGTAVPENRDCSCSASAVLRDDRSKSLLSKVAIRLRKDALEVDSKRFSTRSRRVPKHCALKWTLHRCHAAPVSSVAIADFNPACTSLTTRRTPWSPRSLSLRKNVCQLSRLSFATTSLPITSRMPSTPTPYATTTA